MPPKRTVDYISFSLWGDQLKYTKGAVENAKYAAKHFKTWRPIFYCSRNVPQEIIRELYAEKALVVECWGENQILPSMWRFLAADIPDARYVIFRDCDSRVTERDYLLVESWTASEKAVHFIQDHPSHKNTLLAGMWGLNVKKFGATFRHLLEKYCKGRENTYGVDQDFLRHVVWPKAQYDMFLSSDLREKPEYVGQVYDADNNPITWSSPTWSEWQ
jgi:hypothetical protein